MEPKMSLQSKRTRMKPGVLLQLLAAVLLLPGVVAAEELWDNGAADGASLGASNAHTLLDDFYVNGGGWWIKGAKVSGFFLNPGVNVANVQVTIWPHNMETNEPDGDAVVTVPVQSFTVAPTGAQYSGYDELSVNITLQSTYLKSQRYYWIGVRITNQLGNADFLLTARGNITHEPARIRYSPAGPGTVESEPNVDVAYSISGDRVQIAIPHGLPDDFKIGQASPSKISHTLYLAARSECTTGRLVAGLYEVALESGRPQLYYFGATGKVRQSFAFKTSTDPAQPAFHTPLGDDMCRNAPSLIQEYCQSFVACAAHNICN